MPDIPGQPAAEKAVRDAAMLMARTAPGMLPVYMLFRGVPTDDPKVTVRAGISAGGPSLEYNVKFVTALEPSLLGAIIYMQCLKLGLHHCDKRKKEPLDMLKLASDIVTAEFARQVVDTSVGRNMEIVNRLFPSYWNYWDVLSRHDFRPETDLVLEKLFEIFREEYATMKPKEDPGKKEGKRQDTESREKPKPADGKGEKTPGSDAEESGEESGSESDSGEGKDTGPDGDSGEGETGKEGDAGEGEQGESGEEQGDGDSGEGEQGESGDEGEDTSDGQGGDGDSGEGADGGSVPDDSPGDGAPGDGGGDDGSGDGESGDEPGESGGSDGGESGEGDGEGEGDDFGAMARYFSLSGAGSDLEKWGEDPVTGDEVTAAVQDALAKGMFDRTRGQLPVMLRNANRVKVDTGRMFRKFMSSVRTDEPVASWGRRNRAYLHMGRPIAPGYLYRDTHRILFCVDVSGSMVQSGAITECMTVMENAVDGLSIDLVYWDSVCSPVFARPRSLRDMAVYAGGMTNPECVLRKLGPEVKKYDGLIFLTDGIFEWPEPACPKKIMILRTNGDHAFPEWCRFTGEMNDFIGAA